MRIKENQASIYIMGRTKKEESCPSSETHCVRYSNLWMCAVIRQSTVGHRIPWSCCYVFTKRRGTYIAFLHPTVVFLQIWSSIIYQGVKVLYDKLNYYGPVVYPQILTLADHTKNRICRYSSTERHWVQVAPPLMDCNPAVCPELRRMETTLTTNLKSLSQGC